MKTLGVKKGRGLGALLALALGLIASTAGPASAAGGASWPSGGQNISNTHSNPAETKIGADNAQLLDVKWTYTTHGDVSAIPAVVGGAAYFPDWGGYLNKVDAATGAPIWSHPISDYDGVPGSVSRAAPAVVGNTVYLGNQNGGWLSAINATTGAGIWSTRVDTGPFPILTAGPLVYNGVVYQGVASSEEAVAATPGYPCCSFRGSVVAIDAATGGTLWKTYTIPDNGGAADGYSGGAIWGTTPAIDPASNTLFVTTGNNYSVPQSVKDCQAAGGPPPTVSTPTIMSTRCWR
jgi:polyvinyl alcohol dehydrogenase (cytochrome)